MQNQLRTSTAMQRSLKASLICLMGIWLMGLGSCATRAEKVSYCPVPVLPDDCAIEAIALGSYDECLNHFLNSVKKQQEEIIDNCPK